MRLLMALIYHMFYPKLCSSATQGYFTKVIISKDYLNIWPNTEYSFDLSACFSLCLMSDYESCHAVIYDENDETCSFGTIIVTAPLKSKTISKSIPLENDLVIYGRKDVIKPKKGYIPVLLSFYDDEVSQTRLTAMPEVTGDVPSAIDGTKIRDDSITDHKPSFIIYFGDGYVACGGQGTQGYYKSCRKWSYQSEEWSDLPGEMSHSRRSGTGVLLAGKNLFVIFGKHDVTQQELSTAEAYDFFTEQWEVLPDAPYGAYDNGGVAISDTEVLLAGGSTNSGTLKKALIFNMATKEYTPIGDIPTENGFGITNVECDKARDSLVALCGAWTSNRIYRFDTVGRVWLPLRDTDNMPSNLLGHFISIHRHMWDHRDSLYFMTTTTVYEIEYDGQDENAPVISNDIGTPSKMWALQMLVPVYYDEIFLTT